MDRYTPGRMNRVIVRSIENCRIVDDNENRGDLVAGVVNLPTILCGSNPREIDAVCKNNVVSIKALKAGMVSKQVAIDLQDIMKKRMPHYDRRFGERVGHYLGKTP